MIIKPKKRNCILDKINANEAVFNTQKNKWRRRQELKDQEEYNLDASKSIGVETLDSAPTNRYIVMSQHREFINKLNTLALSQRAVTGKKFILEGIKPAATEV